MPQVKVLHVIKNEKMKTKAGKEIFKSYYALEVEGFKGLILINPSTNKDYTKIDLIAEKKFQGFKEDKKPDAEGSDKLPF